MSARSVLRGWVVLLGLAAGVADAAPRLEVVAPPELAAVADEVRRLGEEDLSPLCALVGVDDVAPPIRVALVAERSPLADRTPEWIAGFALPDQSTVILFPARTRSYPDHDLRSLLHHEVTHVLISRASVGAPVPRWLDEGLAAVAAREWGLEDRARFTFAVIGGGLRSVHDLEVGFGGTRDEVIRSYALSAAFVRYLRQRFGPDLPARVLRSLGERLDVREAFRRSTGVYLATVERDFFGRRMMWTTWVPFLTSTTVVWMATTLLALWAIRRRRARSAAIRARWEEEEAAVEEPPSEIVN